MERVERFEETGTKYYVVFLITQNDWLEEGGNGRSKRRMITIPVL
jgi:hypothetical protein